jgi:predicted secreted acid phosphatase
VSIDADATVLDNSALNVAGELTFQSLTYAQLNAWVRRAAAEPVPGVLSFFDTVNELGGKIAIITNRSHRHHAGDTLNNLRRWGIEVDPKQVCILGRMPQDRQERNPDEWRAFGYKNDKDRRRRLLMEGKADLCWAGIDNPDIRQSWQRPHDIVMYLGDNIQDFPKFEQKEIARHPQRASDRIGVDFFLFPNPIYGSWK